MRYPDVAAQRLDFAEFYRASRDVCLRAVLAGVGDRDTADDLVAEAFARACASWRTVSAHPAPAAWVVRTALNTHVSWWRHRRRELLVSDPGRAAGRPAAEPGTGSVDPPIMAALQRLPARQREVVVLRLVLDLDTATTAQTLGVSPNTVMAHMTRALAALRTDLAPQRRQENRS